MNQPNPATIPPERTPAIKNGAGAIPIFFDERIAQEKEQRANDDAAAHKAAAHVVGPVQEIAALHQLVENAALDARADFCKTGSAAGKLDVAAATPFENMPASSTSSCAFRPAHSVGSFFKWKTYSLLWSSPSIPDFFLFLDHDVAAHGEVDDRRRDVAHRRVSSTSVPASAGVIPSGGAYCTATGPTRGSRPRVYHSQNMNRNTGTGKKIGQLLARNWLISSLVPGCFTKPLSQPTTTVSPS